MKDGTLSLWFALPGDALSQEESLRCVEMLSASERDRLEAIRPADARREYLVAHTLMRRALSSVTSIAPNELRFRSNAYGKPEIEPERGVRFNLSHSRELAACLISADMEVGVDTEHVDRAAEVLEIAESIFSPLERKQLLELPDRERPERALSLWVLKEAYVKARGMGLSIPLKEFSMVFDESGDIRLEQHGHPENETDRWSFCTFEHRDHRIALFAETRASIGLECLELRPVLGIPKPLDARQPTWFPLQKG